MQGRNIYAIGETVYDILFKGEQPVAARPGGAMLNASVSLGRLGLPIHLITEIGNDQVGSQIQKFLNDNGVMLSKTAVFSGGSTALALAFLDDNENASYTFYKDYPEERLNFKMPAVTGNDIILFGSSFSISREVREKLTGFLSAARKAGAIIIYDPNFRESHLPELSNYMNYIRENLEFADIVRGSHDDFKLIFNTHSPDEAYEQIKPSGPKVLIYTAGEHHVSLRSARFSWSVGVPLVNPISTIGAGDNFNAGVIYSLFKMNIGRDRLANLKKDEWDTIVDSGITFGTMVCESFDNYIPETFGRKFKNPG